MIRISPSRAAVRETAKAGPTKPPPLKQKFFPSPRLGLVLADNIATQSPGAALVLDNWVCTTTGIRARGGTALRATLPSGAKSMWEYASGAGKKKFAATTTAIYDLTTHAVPGSAPAPVVTGKTGGQWIATQFATPGGVYQVLVNGSDAALTYDGTAFAAHTITGVDTTKLSHVWAYASRLFFVEKGTMRFWYLGPDAIGGAAQSFNLAGVFQRGGELLFGCTWSVDSGGLSAKCVFVSTMGEVAVYQGNNPGDAGAWSLSGLYLIGSPIGVKATMQAGADVLIGTDVGIIPLTQAIAKDTAALAVASVSASIEPLWRAEMSKRASQRIEVLKCASQGLMMVNLPGSGALVANLDTGGWSTFTGLDMQTMAVWSDRAFFADEIGRVFEMESGGSDNGVPYTCSYSGVFDHADAPGRAKAVTMARALFKTYAPVVPQVSLSTDYVTQLPAAPSSAANYPSASEWDVALWDVGVWDASSAPTLRSDWTGIGRTGEALAPQVQLTFGVTPLPKVELVGVSLIYEDGGAIS